MGTNLVEILIENARQVRTMDDRYYRNMPWIFRLVVDGGINVGPVGEDGTALFPLPMGPDEFSYELPFASTITPTQESGKVVERGGIITGQIRMGGSTGFKLRRHRALTAAGAGGEFTGILGEYGVVFNEDISGQMAFWILANRCFEGYSKLCQDPQWASKTRLELHIMKERLHLEVEPRSFGLRRSSGRERVSYRYEMQLEVLGEAQELWSFPADEVDIFDKIAEGRAMIRETITAAKATLQDLNAARGELTQWVSDCSSILEDMASVVQAAEDLVEGVKDTFDIPKDFIDSLSDVVDSTADFLEEALTLYPDVTTSFRELGDQLDAFRAASVGRYRDAWATIADTYNDLTDPVKTADDLDSEDQAIIQSTYDNAVDANGTQSIEQVFDSQVLPGDLQRQGLAKLGARMDRYAYDGVQSVYIGQGDTIQSLAAKHLGDARKWPDIVAANQLEYPYITRGPRLPNTLLEGDSILVPVGRRLRRNQVISEMADLDALLGVDAKSVLISKEQWGWEVDVAHGATDIKKVRGIDNMAQGLASRLRTTQGENILQPSVGVRRSVGQKQFGDNVAEAVMVTRQQVLADPRVQRLISLDFETELDAIDLSMRVQPLGYSTARVVRIPLT